MRVLVSKILLLFLISDFALASDSVSLKTPPSDVIKGTSIRNDNKNNNIFNNPEYLPSKENPIVGQPVVAVEAPAVIPSPTPTPVRKEVPVASQVVKKPVERVGAPVKVKKTAALAPNEPVLHKFHLNVYTGFTSVKFMGAELEYNLNQYWSLGGLYQTVVLSETGSPVQLMGSSVGASIHYRFIPYYYGYQWSTFDPGVYANIEFMKLKSSLQGSLPSYMFGSAGADFTHLLVKSLRLSFYGRLGLNYLYYSSDLRSVGSDLSVGLRLSF